jgi:serine/threonine protein kinase
METDVAGPVKRIGRYELREPLGSGGFATVYRAYDPVLDREVALKVVHTHLVTDPKVRERFVREGRALARVRHPSVVQVHDAGEVQGAAYIAMDLIEGRPLDIVLRDLGPLPLEQVLGIVEQVAAGLAAVHARNVIHRDVKPANIIHDASTQEAVLGDLGLALELDVSTITTSDAIMGTPGYLAPEQVDPDGAITASTDVYQLGATIFALLAGRAPFSGKPAQVLYSVVHVPAPNLHDLNPAVPVAVATVVAWAMAKDPASRPGGALELVRQLRSAVASQTEGAPSTAGSVLPGVPAIRGTEPDPSLPTTPPDSLDPTPPNPESRAKTPITPVPLPAPVPGSRPPSRPRASAGRTSIVTRQVPREPGAPQLGAAGDRRLPVARRLRRRSGWIPAVVAGAVLLLGGVTGFALLDRSGDDDGRRANVVESTAVPGPDEPALTQAPTTTLPASPVTSPTPAPPPSPSATATPTAATPPPATRTPAPSATASPPSTTVVAVSGAATPDGVAAAMAADIAARGYEPRGSLVSIPAGPTGEHIHVQVGVRRDCSSDRCEKVFIRWNDRFLGTDTRLDSHRIVSISPGRQASFSVTYEDRESARDSVTVVYTCSASRCNWSQTPPGHPPTG